MKKAIALFVLLVSCCSVAEARWWWYTPYAYPYRYWYYNPFTFETPPLYDPPKPRKPPVPAYKRYERQLENLNAKYELEKRQAEIAQEKRAVRLEREEHKPKQAKSMTYNGVKYGSFEEFKKSRAYMEFRADAEINARMRDLR